MATKLLAIAAAIVFSGLGVSFAHADGCTQDDIKLKYTEIGQLIQAEQAGDPAAAQEMVAKMHEAMEQMGSGEINSVQFCRAYDALIAQMKTNHG